MFLKKKTEVCNFANDKDILMFIKLLKKHIENYLTTHTLFQTGFELTGS